MLLFDDVFQIIVEVHNKMTELSEDDSEKSWFAQIDEKVFNFRCKVTNRVRDVLETRSKNNSRRSASKSSSRSLSSTQSSKSNSSTRERALLEKFRVAELIAETKFLEKQKAAEYQTETFMVQAKLIRAQTRMEVFHKIEDEHTETPHKMLSFEDHTSTNKLHNSGPGGTDKIYYQIM